MMRPVLTSLGLQLLATLLANSTYSSKIVLSQSQISKTFRVLTHIQHPCPLFFNLLPRIASLSSKSSQLTLLMTWLVGLVGETTSEGLKIVKATIVALLCGPGLPAVDLELPAGLVRQILQADLYKHKDLVEMSLETLGLLCADSTVPPLLNAMKAHAKLAEIVRSPHELSDRAILAVVGIGLSAEKKLLYAIAEGIASRPTRGPIMKEAKMILVANAGLDVSIQRKLQTTAKEDQGSSAQVNEFDEDGAVVYLNRDSRGEEYEFLPFKLANHDSTAIGEFPLEIDPLKLFKSQSPFEDLDIIKPKQQQQPAQFYDQEISRSKSGTSQPRSTEKIRSESPKSKNSSSMLAMNSSTANNRNQPKDSSSSLRNESVVFKNDSVVQSQKQSSMKNAHQIKPTSKPVVEIKEQASQSRIETFGLGRDATPSDARIMDQDWEESYSRPNRLPSPTPRSEKNTLPPSDQFTHRQPAQSPTPPRVLTVQHKHSQRGSSRGDSDREREELEARLAKLEQSFKQTLVLLGETVQQESVHLV